MTKWFGLEFMLDGRRLVDLSIPLPDETTDEMMDAARFTFRGTMEGGASIAFHVSGADIRRNGVAV